MGQDARSNIEDLSRTQLVELVIDLRDGKGRSFDIDKFDYVIEQMYEGRSARSVFKHEEPSDAALAPAERSFYKWLSDSRLNATHDLANRYDTAQLGRSYRIFDEMLEIADDGTNDWMESVDGAGGVLYKLNGEHVQRSRLRIDTRKWVLGRMHPKKFADRPEKHEETGRTREIVEVELHPDQRPGE